MTVNVEKSGPVWTVIHNRPEARNAMDPSSADALTRAFLEFDADDAARVAVLYGEGGAFCAGWDLKYVSTLDQTLSAWGARYSSGGTAWQWRRDPAWSAGTVTARIG